MLLVLGLLISKLAERRQRWLTILLSFVLFIVGYYAHGKIFFNQEDSRFVPEITRAAGSNGNGHTAIVYFTHGEPETFNPIGWINQFREFDEQGIAFVPFVARPLFVYILRNKYLEAGSSNHRKTHFEMVKSLEAQYRLQGDSTTQFYISFLDDEPRPDAAVIQAMNDGADKIIVSNVFLTVSNHTAEGQHLIHELEVEEKYGIEMKFTQPLWSSELLKKSFADKVYAVLGDTPKDKVAIAFVGHGQPDEWDVEWATETEQEQGFRKDLIELFVKEGFKKENLGSAWMEFKEPKPVELMEDFMNNGVEKVFYFSAAISADAMHSQIDIPRLVHEYPFPDEIDVVNLGAWNNHPTVIRAIKHEIDVTINDPDAIAAH